MSVPPSPDPEELGRALAALAPLRALHSPRCAGIENIPTSGGFLLVGNHSIYGVLDVPPMFAEVFERRGRVLRSLGDHAHYAVPAGVTC